MGISLNALQVGIPWSYAKAESTTMASIVVFFRTLFC